ncbi:hypothetical protein ADK64_41490 [Streptomyces sp. MMG1121]|nr:hypothetical protein ADK64_41490 [Streptomyces sp. MMG1121]
MAGTTPGAHSSRPSKNRTTSACERARTEVPPERWTASIRTQTSGSKPVPTWDSTRWLPDASGSSRVRTMPYGSCSSGPIRLGGHPRAHVQEQADAVAGDETGGPVHELAVGPGRVLDAGEEGRDLARGLGVDGTVVLAVEEPVVHPRGVRLAGVDPLRAESDVCHVGSPC